MARASGGFTLFSNSAMTSGVSLAAGGGSWASLSDRASKTGLEPISDGTILNKVASLPISTWSYVSEHGVRHLGPMAQDFYAAFGIGEDDKHITSIDEDGVALAAIKALHRENTLLKARMLSQDAVVRDLQPAKLRQDAAVQDLRLEMQKLNAEVTATKTR